MQAGGARGAVGEAGRRLGCHPASSAGGCPGPGPRHPTRRPSAPVLVGGRLEGCTAASLAGIEWRGRRTLSGAYYSGANFALALQPGRRGRAVPSAPLPAPSSRRSLAPPPGRPERREGGRKSGDAEPGPERHPARPARPEPRLPGDGKRRQRVGWRRAARGCRRRLSSRSELAVPSPHHTTSPPPGSPRRSPFTRAHPCPTLFMHRQPLLSVPALAKISCVFL